MPKFENRADSDPSLQVTQARIIPDEFLLITPCNTFELCCCRSNFQPVAGTHSPISSNRL
ncbi:MAG: hypothetical protein VSS75_009925 [Candidatus Parabeggiatoa sp.]|nr:hypothetical protein [Candidatus Parabeggiatoa sp.]